MLTVYVVVRGDRGCGGAALGTKRMRLIGRVRSDSCQVVDLLGVTYVSDGAWGLLTVRVGHHRRKSLVMDKVGGVRADGAMDVGACDVV